jgi:thiamine transport system substrate-binding protein
MMSDIRVPVAALAIGLIGVASGCSVGTDKEPSADPTAKSDKVVLVTHDSWKAPKGALAEFTALTGYKVEVLKAGDAGELTNKLVLSAGDPVADVAFGVDNTFASRALEADVFAEYTSGDLTEGARTYMLQGDEGHLTPIDWGDVCVNIDKVWFAEHDLTPPESLEDLTDPAYAGLFVVPGATTSSPGLAFLLASIGAFGEDAAFDYVSDLVANDTKFVSGWEEAYFVDFTTGGGGDRPIVLSYNSSPPFTIPKGETEPTTSALLDTCFRQVEYAGVLQGAANPDGAEALIDFLLGDSFQSGLPDSMYVFPTQDGIELPDLWAKWAVASDDPIDVDPADIAANRSDWLKRWVDATSE